MDEKLIERCVESWVAAYEHAGKWKERGRAGKAQFDGVSVDELLADAGIHFPTGVHRMSLYRQYEHEIVKRAYERMGIVRPMEKDPPLYEQRGGGEPPIDADERASMVLMYSLGMTVGEIAAELKRAKSAVHRQLKRADVTLREPGWPSGKRKPNKQEAA